MPLFPLDLGFDFVDSIGVRELGVGGSVSGIIDDPNIIFYNPAIIGLQRFTAGSASSYTLGDGRTLFAASYAQKTWLGNFSFGLATAGNFFGQIDTRVVQILPGIGDVSSLLNMDGMFVFGYGIRFFNNFSAGLNFKYLTSTILGFNTAGFPCAFDAGLTGSFNLLSSGMKKDLMISAVVKNIGPVLKYNRESSYDHETFDEIPLNTLAVLSLSEFVPKLNTTFSIAIESEVYFTSGYPKTSTVIANISGKDHYDLSPISIRLGMDMWEDAAFSPRAGIIIDQNRFSGTWGLGYNQELLKLRWSLDYAMVLSYTAASRQFAIKNAFGLTVRTLAAPLMNVQSEFIAFPDTLINFGDRLSAKSADDDEDKRTDIPSQRRFVLDIGRIDANDAVRARPGFLEQVETALREKLERNSSLVVFDERKGMKRESVNAELTSSLTIQGELVSLTCMFRHPRTGKTLLKNTLTQNIAFDREKKPYDAIKAVSRNGKLILLSDASSATENRDLAQVESLTTEGAQFVATSLAEALTGIVTVQCATIDAEVFLNRKRVGSIGKDKSFTFRAPEGDNMITVSKFGLPAFTTDPPIKVVAGDTFTVAAALKETDFYTTVNFVSFPSGLAVSLDDNALTNKTAYAAKKVKNGMHSYFARDARGNVRERKLTITRNMVHTVYELSSINDNFRVTDKTTWRRIKGDDDISVRSAGNGLVIQGKTGDDNMKGNGVATAPFTANDTITADLIFNIGSGNKGALCIGLIDEKKNGYLMRYRDEAVSKLAFGVANRADEYIPAARAEPGVPQRIRLVYNVHGNNVTMTVNDVKVYEERCVLDPEVRFVIFADSAKEGDAVNFTVESLKLENN
ncbi:MAG: hypothetical protein HZC28_11400 [Spirochaetes bacterium]|nr:hypothetical protein [Spirochaetota bacterium]